MPVTVLIMLFPFFICKNGPTAYALVSNAVKPNKRHREDDSVCVHRQQPLPVFVSFPPEVCSVVHFALFIVA